VEASDTAAHIVSRRSRGRWWAPVVPAAGAMSADGVFVPTGCVAVRVAGVMSGSACKTFRSVDALEHPAAGITRAVARAAPIASAPVVGLCMPSVMHDVALLMAAVAVLVLAAVARTAVGAAGVGAATDVLVSQAWQKRYQWAKEKGWPTRAHLVDLPLPGSSLWSFSPQISSMS
jgi:hypothetical protein